MPRSSARVRLTSLLSDTLPPVASSRLGDIRTDDNDASPSRRLSHRAETTEQRSIRAIVKTYFTIRTNWEAIIAQGLQCLKRLAMGQATSGQSNHASDTEAAILAMVAVFEKLTKQYDGMKTLNTQMQNVLVSACDKRSFEYGFREELFMTWTISHFAEAFEHLRVVHMLAYFQAKSTVRQLCDCRHIDVDQLSDFSANWRTASLMDDNAIIEFADICEVEMTERVSL